MLRPLEALLLRRAAKLPSIVPLGRVMALLVYLLQYREPPHEIHTVKHLYYCQSH